MDAGEFCLQRPCIEEIDGYLQFMEKTPENLLVIKKYQAQLMTGKVQPAATRWRRKWKYHHRRKPVFKG